MHLDTIITDRRLHAALVVAALIFSVSYAFGQYVRYKENNLAAVNTWINCVKTESFTDRAYNFCKEKTAESYLFKESFDWATGTDRQ
jgi:hypothetical protein